MPIYVGGTEITDLTVGSTEIQEVYAGSTKIWERSIFGAPLVGNAVAAGTSVVTIPNIDVADSYGLLYVSTVNAETTAIPAGYTKLGGTFNDFLYGTLYYKALVPADAGLQITVGSSGGTVESTGYCIVKSSTPPVGGAFYAGNGLSLPSGAQSIPASATGKSVNMGLAVTFLGTSPAPGIAMAGASGAVQSTASATNGILNYVNRCSAAAYTAGGTSTITFSGGTAGAKRSIWCRVDF